jgi:predicted  nucleic acid-binding Zn ribbon protein
MSREKKKPKKIISPDINQDQSNQDHNASGRLITATELRNMDKLKQGGHPSRNQNYRVHKTARDFE